LTEPLIKNDDGVDIPIIRMNIKVRSRRHDDWRGDGNTVREWCVKAAMKIRTRTS